MAYLLKLIGFGDDAWPWVGGNNLSVITEASSVASTNYTGASWWGDETLLEITYGGLSKAAQTMSSVLCLSSPTDILLISDTQSSEQLRYKFASRRQNLRIQRNF